MDCRVIPVSWFGSGGEDARTVRLAVFVDEQRVPEQIEMDEHDPEAFHVVAYDGSGTPCGTGRLYADSSSAGLGRIGRMAVTRHARGQGVGALIMEVLIREAKARGMVRAALSAQTHAIPFYSRFGFRVTGEEFIEAGIPHQNMEREL